VCHAAAQTQVHNAQSLMDDSSAGGKVLRPVASPLEKEIRSSLLAIAEEQGLDGHRSCLTKFSELLLLNGVISTQQMGVALDLVEALFEPGARRCLMSTQSIVQRSGAHVCSAWAASLMCLFRCLDRGRGLLVLVHESLQICSHVPAFPGLVMPQR